jgi:hypothetical protein
MWSLSWEAIRGEPERDQTRDDGSTSQGLLADWLGGPLQHFSNRGEQCFLTSIST